MTLLQLVDTMGPTVRWLCVPSRTNIPSNERVGALAEEGTVSPPVYHVPSLTERRVINLELPSTPTPPRAPTVPRSLDIAQVITPCLDSPALCGRKIAPHEPKAEHVIPKSLDFSDALSSSSPSGTDSGDSDCTMGGLADMASTGSVTGSLESDNPGLVWAAFGLTALATPLQPQQCRRLKQARTTRPRLTGSRSPWGVARQFQSVVSLPSLSPP